MIPLAPAAAGAVVARAPRVELADIVRAHAADYRRTHGLSRAQHRALDAIASCRTAVLGGHRAVCTACGAERLTYNSCLLITVKNRGDLDRPGKRLSDG